MNIPPPAGSVVRANPLASLYDFVRNHLSVVNGLVLASGTLVGVLDFLAPRLSILPRLIYSGTACLVALMVLAAIAPVFVSKSLSVIGLAVVREDLIPLWRRPAWQVAVCLLATVSVVGFASVAKADQGGALASRFPEVRGWQESVLSLHRDLGEIGTGVRQANDKLDRVVASVDPANVADRCPDLECALQGGASSKTIRRLFEHGAKVPGNPINNGELLRMAAINRGEGRLESVDLLFQHGIGRDAKFLANFLSPGAVSQQGLRWARQIDELGGSTRMDGAPWNPTGDEDLGRWNDAQGCFLRNSGGTTLLELAGLLGDEDLARHLIEGGSKFPTRPLVCEMKRLDYSNVRREIKAYARVVFDQATGKVLGVKGAP